MNSEAQPSIRPLTVADLPEAVETQSRAFLDDPLWLYLVPDEQKRKALLRKFFRPFFRFAILNEQAYGIGPEPGGVVVWSEPGQQTRLSAILGAGFQNLLFTPYILRFFRAVPIFGKFDEMKKKYAPDPHYYLQTIAVRPECQGKGLASKLIRPFLDAADARGQAAYTETMTPGNVGLYEHFQ